MTVDEPPRRASSCAWVAVIAGPWTTKFMVQKSGTDHVSSGMQEGKTWSVPVLRLRSQLQQDVLHRLRTLLPRWELGVDAQPVGAGEAGGAAFLADELDHLAAVDRRVLHELELPRLVRGVDARDAERPRGEPHFVALDQRARGIRQIAEAVDELFGEGLELFARLGIGESLVEGKALMHV